MLTTKEGGGCRVSVFEETLLQKFPVSYLRLSLLEVVGVCFFFLLKFATFKILKG